VFALAFALAVPAAVITSAGATPVAESPVGYAHVTVPGNTALRGDPSNQLQVVVWYPAPAGTTAIPIVIGPPGSPYFVEGRAAQDAQLAASPAHMPLIVVSHGTGGTAMDLSWLCAGLAAAGSIVASVDHAGNNALQPETVAGNTLWWMRADDLSRVIDGLLATPRFAPRIDRSRIGAAGFSLGGLTVLMLAGARADVSLLETYCASKPKTPLCTGESTPEIPDLRTRAQALAASDPTYRAALAANSISHRDARVKAVFSIAPALGAAIVPGSLGAIDVPAALVAGFGDPILPVGDNAIADALGIPNAELTIFPKPVAHYTFLTACAPAGERQFAPICGDSGPTRIAVHNATVDLARSFFAANLR